MKAPDIPLNEAQRQAVLDATGLLDSDPEERFDRLTRVAARMFDVPIALVSLVDRDRQWFKSCQGLDARETPRDISFCGHAILQPDLFVVEDALADERFADNPLVQSEPRIRFYAGAPLRGADGHRLGTLCLIDRRPRKLTDDERPSLRDLADAVEREIGALNDARAFQALKQSEHRARAVIDGTRVGTWEWNIKTGDTVFNERWAEICGYTLAELAPVSIQTWLDLTHPDDLKRSEDKLQAHFRGDADEYDCRCRMRHKDGHWVWVHDRGRVFEWDEDRQPLKMYGTHADITEEMRTLEQLDVQNRALRILNDLALDQDAGDSEKIANALAQGAEFLDLPLAIVSEITGEAYTVKAFHAPADSGLHEGQVFDLRDTYCAILFAARTPIAIDHMAQSPYRDQPCYKAFGLESYIAAPIYIKDRLYGTLNFSSPEPRPQPFSDIEKTFVTLLAKWLSGVLEGQITSQTLTKLVQQAPGMLYQYRLWPDGRSAFPYASPGIADIYGLRPDEVQTDAAAVFDRIHPGDLARLERSITESATALSTWQHQYRVKAGDRWRWVEGRATPERLADGSTMWHGYITDIHDIKRSQLLLEESEEQLRWLFELSPIGIALADFHTGAFLDVNDALLRPSGYSRDEFLALPANRLMPDAFEDMRAKALTELRKSGRFGPYECEIAGVQGRRFPALVQGLLIRTPSGRSLVWTLIEDVSERKKIERMKNEFISVVSHELRTPVTSITGSLGLIAGGALGEVSEPIQRMVTIAKRNSEQLKHLIDDLLDIERLISGRLQLVAQPHAIRPLLDDIVEQMRTYAVEQEVSLSVEAEPGDPVLPVDDRRLQQAVANLVSNAIKFSHRGGDIRIRLHRHQGERWRISVIDQGTGIPASFRDRIFQKFAQADSSDTRGRQGTGLGLAITREIMTRMGGAVGFDSVEHEGSTFWLDLPAGETTGANQS